MRSFFPLVVLLAACKPPIEVDDSSPVDSTPTTDDTGTPTDDTGTTTVPEATYSYAVSELMVAADGEGFDLDQDGLPDNSLATVNRVVDPLLQVVMGDTPRVIAMVLDGVAAFDEDPSIHVAVFGADDQDGDHSALDNFSGEEVFEAGAAVDEEGHPVDYQDVPVDGGIYTAIFDDIRGVDLGGLQLGADTPLVVGSNAFDENSQNGLLGFGVSAAALVGFAEALGMDPTDAAELALLADLDLDADGTDETVSVALRFGAVSCGLD